MCGFIHIAVGLSVMNSDDHLSCPHFLLPPNFVVRDGTIPKIGSDAAAQDATIASLYNMVRMGGGRWAFLSHHRKQRHCWAFLVIDLVLHD